MQQCSTFHLFLMPHHKVFAENCHRHQYASVFPPRKIQSSGCRRTKTDVLRPVCPEAISLLRHHSARGAKAPAFPGGPAPQPQLVAVRRDRGSSRIHVERVELAFRGGRRLKLDAHLHEQKSSPTIRCHLLGRVFTETKSLVRQQSLRVNRIRGQLMHFY